MLMDKQDQGGKWSQLYRRQISDEECREICDNLKNFFDYLVVLDKKYPKPSESS